ncbi:MAG: protoporphyrinogen oxidase [Planctomycetota bacterium]
MKIAILGAGISGLALARFLIDGGHDPLDIDLFESASKAGGLCHSKTVDGFTYDTSGGHILFSKDKEALDWMVEQGGGEEAYVKRDRHTKIRFEDRWVHYPFENGLGDLPHQANFDCLKGYIDAYHARSTDGSSAPGNFKDWIHWRFGEGIAKHFMDPYNEKIWKRDLREISSGWVAGRVPDAPVDDVLKASIGMRTEGYTHQAMFYYPKQGGFQSITDHMAARLEERIQLSTPITRLEKTGETWKVNGVPYDCVVSTIPLSYMPEIVEGMPQDVGSAMKALEYNGMVTFLLALDREKHPDLSWIYLPHPKQGPTNRVTYMSNYSPGNAPEGKTSFLCEVTVDGNAGKPGAELESEVVDGMVAAGLMTKDELIFADRSDIKHAYIVFDHGYDERRACALSWLEINGIEPLGRFGRFDYDNSDQCVIKARNLAAKLLERAARG